MNFSNVYGKLIVVADKNPDGTIGILNSFELSKYVNPTDTGTEEYYGARNRAISAALKARRGWLEIMPLDDLRLFEIDGTRCDPVINTGNKSIVEVH